MLAPFARRAVLGRTWALAELCRLADAWLAGAGSEAGAVSGGGGGLERLRPCCVARPHARGLMTATEATQCVCFFCVTLVSFNQMKRASNATVACWQHSDVVAPASQIRCAPEQRAALGRQRLHLLQRQRRRPVALGRILVPLRPCHVNTRHDAIDVRRSSEIVRVATRWVGMRRTERVVAVAAQRLLSGARNKREGPRR